MRESSVDKNGVLDSDWKVTLFNVHAYCKIQNYAFYLRLSRDRDVGEGRPQRFVKVLAIYEAMQLHDTIIWIDNDAVVLNFDTRIETFTDKPWQEGAQLIVVEYNWIQNCVFILRRGDWSSEFLQLWWESRYHFADDDQVAFQNSMLLKISQETDRFYDGGCDQGINQGKHNLCFPTKMSEMGYPYPYARYSPSPIRTIKFFSREDEQALYCGLKRTLLPNCFIKHAGSNSFDKLTQKHAWTMDLAILYNKIRPAHVLKSN